MNRKPKPKPFDVVHPDLKNEYHMDAPQNDSLCWMCSHKRERRIFVRGGEYGHAFCSWDCVIEYGDFMQWNYEMARKGERVSMRLWLLTNQGTKYHKMKQLGEI